MFCDVTERYVIGTLRNRYFMVVLRDRVKDRRGIIALETDYCFKMSTNLWIQWDQKRVRGKLETFPS